MLSILGDGLHVLVGHYNGSILLKLVIGGIAGAFTGTYLSSIIPQASALARTLFLAGGTGCTTLLEDII